MNTEQNTDPKPETKFWEVCFTFITRKECRAVVKADTQEEAEAAVENLTSDVLEYGPDRRIEKDFHEVPYCEYEDETVEDVNAEGPYTEEDM